MRVRGDGVSHGHWDGACHGTVPLLVLLARALRKGK